MAKFGNKPMTGEQVRWGFEHLDLTADRIKQLGFDGMIGPLKVSCADHEGTRLSRVHQWDGKEWKVISDWYTGDDSILSPLVKDVAGKYAAEKKITAARLLEGELSCRRPIALSSPVAESAKGRWRRHPATEGS